VKVKTTKLPGVTVIEPQVFSDERGFFLESYHEERYRNEAGIHEKFVQDNHSRSTRGVLRGLHFQKTKPQGKLVRVTQGEVFDVAVDINPESPTFTKWVGIKLSSENHLQMFIPAGYAHGFLVLSDVAEFQYKCTAYYDPSEEQGVLWSDPKLEIAWPFENPVLSDKDASLPTLKS
jgi:dTDP-4-dehydrorhamnose 3,5-epimerase